MGVSDDELRQQLAEGVTGPEAKDRHGVETASPPGRGSLYGKSILLSVLIGMGYVIDQAIRFGLRNAMGTMAYVAFCVFMIASRRLLEKHVGTYVIGTGIHLPPKRRPAWGSMIFVGWVLLALPTFLIVMKMVGSY